MKLKEYTVKEFRSVWDSGAIEVDDKITCLVGKNEAGKTSLLAALYRTNPVIESDAIFDETYDYPKKEVENYRIAVEEEEREEAKVVSCTYELENKDLQRITSTFGSEVLIDQTFHRHTYYGQNKHKYTLKVNDGKAILFLADNNELPSQLSEKLKESSDWKTFLEILQNEEKTETITTLTNLVTEIIKNGLCSYIYSKLISPYVPKFLYFDEYYQIQGCENLDALIQRKAANTLKESDYPLLGLINLARLNLDELVHSQNTQELKNKIDGASNHLTNRVMKFWSQNKHIRMNFDVRNAKKGDPEGMQTGTNIWGEVHDTVHYAKTPLNSRSRGFIWFFSFLAWYEDIKKKKENVILLLDEPGLSLHGRAQGDLLNYFEEELAKHQLIYSTHSPFMVNSKKFERVRIVQDLGVDAKEELPKEQDGTKVVANIFDATEDSLFPLQGALGYEIQQTLFIGPYSLIVEGAADMLFLQAMSAELEKAGKVGLSSKWIITPVGGASKVPTFVSLLGSQKDLKVATLLDIQRKDEQSIENLYKKKLLSKKYVLTYADFLDQAEADVEDLFERDFYIDIVNKEFQVSIKLEDINSQEPRIIKALENYFQKHPLSNGSFSHYRPARYVFENIKELSKKISDPVKERFEKIFQELNQLL